MSQQILMPALSPTMTEGTLAKWLVQAGDSVESGQVIAEIETDKATMEVEAVDEGIIAKIIIEAGSQNVAVNQVIALLAEEGEDASEIAKMAIDTAVSATSQAAEAKAEMVTAKSDTKPVSKIDKGNKIFASPLAKRLANEEGLDLAKITGTGPNERIIKRDIENALKSGLAKAGNASNTQTANNQTVESAAEFELVPLNGMRKIIAKRLVEAKQSIPHFYLSLDMEMDALNGARKQLNDQAPMVEDAPAYKLSLNDMIIKACALALMKVPKANAAFTDQGIQLFKRADISIAVATEGGLITPVIRGANMKSLSQISIEMKQLAAKARANKLMPEEYQGGGFTISNLGMFGIEQFQAIINPPQACILAVGAGIDKPIVKNGEIKIANMMTATLSVDHRAVDGALGAQYLQALKGYIEAPITMLA